MKRRTPSEPSEFDLDAWLARLDAYRDVPFMPEGREQPPMPEDDISFDDDIPSEPPKVGTREKGRKA